jgi:hypothetical protein
MEILPLSRGLVSRVGPYSGEAVHSWDLATRRAKNDSVFVRLLDVGRVSVFMVTLIPEWSSHASSDYNLLIFSFERKQFT